jgi:hypothetical protein
MRISAEAPVINQSWTSQGAPKLATNSATAAESADLFTYATRLQEMIVEFGLKAMNFVAQPKVEETVRQWLWRSRVDPEDPNACDAIAEATMFALELATFTPSLSGATAVDRFARQHRPVGQDELAALNALKNASFRLLRIKSFDRDGLISVEDLATGKALSLLDRDIPMIATGMALAARLCALPSGLFVSLGPLTPLDDIALEVALGFVRPGKGLNNPQRCAAAIYRHVVRHGAPRIPGLNSFPELDDDTSLLAREDSELDALAHAWVKLSGGVEPDLDSINAARNLTSLESVIDALASSVKAQRDGRIRFADAFSRLASIQMETMHRRAVAGFQGDGAPLDRVAAAIDHAILEKMLPRDVRDLFNDLRRLVLATAGARAKAGDENLARVIQRIQALRAKTVDQGCTEQEALASAKKVAELLDRYGLSLSEIELRRQVCEGIGIDTERRRRGAFDSCVPAIAGFCDCRVWAETTSIGSIRYIFFGLPADVEAAHFLYDLIDVTFTTETTQFKNGAIYGRSNTDERRKAINSFQIGLSHGLVGKLKSMKAERDAANKTTSGRDLVPLKTSVVDDELAKLGLSFEAKSRGRRKRVLVEAYEAGQVAGRRFEVRAGIGAANAPC